MGREGEPMSGGASEQWRWRGRPCAGGVVPQGRDSASPLRPHHSRSGCWMRLGRRGTSDCESSRGKRRDRNVIVAGVTAVACCS
ncbi:hypothetical protein E2C01_021873 [Portunus trituberculatus]|uniref:Uncharacterized protein n=1 Tax=Portunus trituberculatus TaxID=210409 RepID=A0A5B7E7F1_PORTR|nr:hypothetical protein [Portunus trituberculatus]